MLRLTAVAAAVGMLCAGAAFAQTAAPAAAAPDLQQQVNDIKGALPKFAVPMREVGDRFQNMYWAAKGGNWALAAYMAKYMNGAMNPAKVTKPAEYKTWASFYSGTREPVAKAIATKDFKAFDKAYKEVIPGCNGCHEAMGYGFIQVVPLKGPVDEGIKYNKPSNPGDVPP